MNKSIFKTIGASINRHAPAILTGVGIAGMLTTTVLAVRATPKALKLIEEEREKKDEPLTSIEIVKSAWKPYIPAAITCALSATSLIFAQRVNARRNAALMAAYEISENALKEYRGKVIETIGKEKEGEVQDAIAKDKLEQAPVPPQFDEKRNSSLVVPGSCETLCYDAYSGRYFRSSAEKIKRAVNELNHNLLTEGNQSLNEFYYIIGLEEIEIGNLLGWAYEYSDGIVDVRFSSHLAPNGVPCLVMSFDRPPVYAF